MSLWIGIFLPRLSLDVLSPARRPSSADGDVTQDAVMVVHDERVVAVTQAAAALGVRVGMRRNGALAMAPQVRPLAQDLAGEAEALHDAAQAVLQYSPQVTVLPGAVVVLEIGAGLRLFGGIRAVCRRIRHTLMGQGLASRLGVAPTAHAAWVLSRARTSRRRRLHLHSLLPVLDALPWHLLPETAPHAEWLRDIGCRTLGGLNRLPREGLQRRTSPALVVRLDQVYGRAPAAFSWIEAAPVFDQTLLLPERIDNAQAAEVAALRLLGWLCDWLAARHLAVRAIECRLDHERGRHARPPTRLVLRLAEPASHPQHLGRLLHERLSTLTLEAAVVAVRLVASELVAQPAPSGTLFPEPGGTPADHRRLIELLTARLGRERVLRAHPQADHRPERANAWVPADTPVVAVPPTDPARPERPFWLLAQPLLLTQIPQPVAQPPASQPPTAWPQGLRYGNQDLIVVCGPERLEAGWWDGALSARDYFIVRDGHHARFWIYHERDTAEGRWFLHGVFA